MRTTQEILDKYVMENYAEDVTNGGTMKMNIVTEYDCIEAMKEYAREAMDMVYDETVGWDSLLTRAELEELKQQLK